MTASLMLVRLDLGIVALWNACADQLRAARVVAVVTLVGAINLPIVHYSVVWWNTLHQPSSIIARGGPRMPPSLLIPLLVMTLAFTFLFATLHVVRMRTEVLRRRAASLERRHAAEAGGS